MTNYTRFTLSQIKYLIGLYRLSADGCGVKNTELARTLGLSKPSVHYMLKSLSALGMVTQKTFGLAHLTEDGHRTARNTPYALPFSNAKWLNSAETTPSAKTPSAACLRICRLKTLTICMTVKANNAEPGVHSNCASPLSSRLCIYTNGSADRFFLKNPQHFPPGRRYGILFGHNG